MQLSFLCCMNVVTFTNTYVFLISLGMNTIKQCLKPYAGIGICASSSLFFCVCNVFVKHLKHVDPLLIACLRLFVIAMLSTPVTVSRFYELEHKY